MPVRSQAQNRKMRGAARSPEDAKRYGVPYEVATEYVEATHGKKVSELPEKVERKK
jgi:hypothetical protein